MARWLALVVLVSGCATTRADARFDVVVLGASGGIDEGDLTSVLLSRAGRGEFIAFDAGTLVAGLRRAAVRGGLAGVAPSEVFARHLHGVFLSHPHLDHVAGLIIASPEAPKGLAVYGLRSTLEPLREHVFGTPLWANFTDEGAGAIGRYHLAPLEPGVSLEVAAAAMKVEALELSHGGVVSTAFLATVDDGSAALYLGDTGPDEVEKSEKLAALWKRVAPLVREQKLKVLFLEASFADPRKPELLFGHLTPSWILKELAVLEREAGTLRGLTLVVTHLKPSVDGGEAVRDAVRSQLAPLEARGVTVVLPVAGARQSY
ncbi:MAG: 3',5'-cyclic-nucleotide phosphodiesterase [Myxococcaceae bacterium]